METRLAAPAGPLVTSLAGLRAAVTGATSKVVQTNGIIIGDGATVDVGNRTTIVGIGSNSGVTGGGFRVKKGTNTSTNIWVDHNTVSVSSILSSRMLGSNDMQFTSDLDHDKDSCDGMLDMNHGTEHIHSNYFDNVIDSDVDSRDGAQTLVEDHVFNSVVNPIETTFNGGFSNQRNNVFTDSTLDPALAGVGTLTSVPYTYTAGTASSVASIVTASAGSGKVTSL
ncbi:pectin lyase fold/virulence factor [Amylostereum chailletii]|nr:pectin lyase fold/virulence factor [Amylostereum chailletii]